MGSMRPNSTPPRTSASTRPARGAGPSATSTSGTRPVTFEDEPADLEDSGPRRRDRWYTTGEMARLSNNTLRTVRFYEEAGILRPVGRTEGGHRLFERPELDRLLLVSDLREAGMSLEEIRTLLDARDNGASGAEAARNVVTSLRRHVSDINHKVEVLTRLHDDLTRTVESASDLLECGDHKYSPESCNACAKLEATRTLPRAMRVLFPVGGGRALASSTAASSGSGKTSAAPGPAALAAGVRRR
jgi:DNA-binding transcriptional MerR regulator